MAKIKFTVTSIINRSTIVVIAAGYKGRWMMRLFRASVKCIGCDQSLKKGYAGQQRTGKLGLLCESCVKSQLVVCQFCGVECPRGEIPLKSDNAAWAEIATQHSGSCSYVRTRGERQTPKPIVPRVWTKEGWKRDPDANKHEHIRENLVKHDKPSKPSNRTKDQ
jgi:hypothetical protein